MHTEGTKAEARELRDQLIAERDDNGRLYSEIEAEQKAIDYDYIYKNPCAHVVAPRRDDPKRSALSIEEGARLMAEVDGSEAEAYAKMDKKEARRAYREEHGIAKERKAFRGLHQVTQTSTGKSGAWITTSKPPPTPRSGQP